MIILRHKLQTTLLAVILLSPFAIQAQTWRDESKNSFLAIAARPPFGNLRVQLVTVTPGLTVTTAFGHSALRVTRGADLAAEDFYVDFGEYDPSMSFLWRFLRGHARFTVNILPMRSAYEAWDASGRGMFVSDLILTENEKAQLLAHIVENVGKNAEGYEYHNFKNNCVTFMRDMISNAKGKKVSLPDSAIEKKNTWRTRVLDYSNENVWLRIHEKLLFDYTTDQVRDGHTLIYLPDDLKLALETAGWVGKPVEVIRDRTFHPPKNRDIFGTVGILFMFLVLIAMLPVPALKRFQSKGIRAFAVFSGLGGLLAFLVFAVTSFDFMSHNVTWLALCPVDFALWTYKPSARWFYFAVTRLSMAILALLLTLTVVPQTLTVILAFSISFFVLFTLECWKQKQALVSNS
ncbi:MAG: DUF4105 domain-containing protein [Spirochaetia bacterium]|nr:DUF4105 domain-containing protein [Spirochaetia bacterium]